MGRRRCCCLDCLVDSDNFNSYPDSTNVPNWDERSGDWEALTKRLRENGTVGAAIVHDTTAVHNTSLITATTPSVVEDAKYRVLCNWVDDSNYHFAQYEFNAATFTLSLWKRTAGVDAQLHTRTWSGDFRGLTNGFGLCFSSKEFHASTAYAPYGIWIPNPTPFPTGKKAGFGNGSTKTIDYDDFVWSLHQDSLPQCYRCTCRCDATVLPMILRATLTFTGGLGACSTATITLTAVNENDPDFGSEEFQWYGEGNMSCAGCASPLADLDFAVTFRCGCSGPGRFYLNVEESSGTAGDADSCETSYVCDPFSATFDFPSYVVDGFCSGISGDASDLQVIVDIP